MTLVRSLLVFGVSLIIKSVGTMARYFCVLRFLKEIVICIRCQCCGLLLVNDGVIVWLGCASDDGECVVDGIAVIRLESCVGRIHRAWHVDRRPYPFYEWQRSPQCLLLDIHFAYKTTRSTHKSRSCLCARRLCRKHSGWTNRSGA